MRSFSPDLTNILHLILLLLAYYSYKAQYLSIYGIWENISQKNWG